MAYVLLATRRDHSDTPVVFYYHSRLKVAAGDQNTMFWETVLQLEYAFYTICKVGKTASVVKLDHCHLIRLYIGWKSSYIMCLCIPILSTAAASDR